MNIQNRSAAGDEEGNAGFRNLRVWERAFDLAVAIFKIADKIPEGLGISLNGQMRIAALSVPSYIARGLSRSSGKEFLRGLYLAQGALSELETSLFLCAELGYATDLERRRVETQIREVRRMTASIISRLRAALGSGNLKAISEEIAGVVPHGKTAPPGGGV